MKNSLFPPAASLLPHRFVTIRRGSPAARSGLIRPGNRLESVEGRSVVNLPHRELAQILRRAGNTLRLTVVPRASTRELHMFPSIALLCIMISSIYALKWIKLYFSCLSIYSKTIVYMYFFWF